MDTRSIALLGEEKYGKLKGKKVVVFGLGGVGGICAEALLRSGIEKLVLVDGDVFSESNLNRQIFATRDTVGLSKTECAKKRLLSIFPGAEIETKNAFWEAGKDDMGILEGADYVVDAIDSVPAKVDIIKTCHEKNIPIISSMGTGNKTDISRLCVADVSKTSVCPLARAVRNALKKTEVKKLKVVFSTELPQKADTEFRAPASMIFVPAGAGLMIASEVIKDLVK